MATASSSTPVLTPAGKRILDTASTLFYERGIGAVGVELIAEAAEVTKKTLYDRFGSKAGLVEAYLRTRDLRWRTFLTTYVADHGGDTAEGKILAAFDALGEWAVANNPRGCGFVNASAELTDPHHPGRLAIAEQKGWTRQFFAQFARDAGVADAELFAKQLVVLYEGACVAYGLELDDDAAATAKAAAATLLSAR